MRSCGIARFVKRLAQARSVRAAVMAIARGAVVRHRALRVASKAVLTATVELGVASNAVMTARVELGVAAVTRRAIAPHPIGRVAAARRVNPVRLP